MTLGRGKLPALPAGTRSDMLMRRARRTLRSPKGLMLLTLLALAAVALPREGLGLALGPLVGAMTAAALADLGLTRLIRGTWIVPDGAMVSGLIVALVLSPQEPWYVAPAGGLIAVVSKHFFRAPHGGRVHVFNPAAFALLSCIVLFASGESWWGGLPDLPLPAVALVIVAGYRIADRVNKLPMVLAFAGTYLGLLVFAVLLTGGDSVRLAALYRVPFLNAAAFFAFFMLTDPPTSPTRTGEQVGFGFLVGLVAYITFLAVSGLSFLLVGLLAGNAWVAWRRARSPRAQARAATRGAHAATVAGSRAPASPGYPAQ